MSRSQRCIAKLYKKHWLITFTLCFTEHGMNNACVHCARLDRGTEK